MSLSFLESSADFEETSTVGGFGLASGLNTFDAVFEGACNAMLSKNINPFTDITLMVKKPEIMQLYKEQVLSGLKTDMSELEANANSEVGLGTYQSLYEQVDQLFDNCTSDFVKESTTVGQLAPIKAIDYPILVKQHLSLATKDVIQTEVSESHVIKKQIEHRWIVENQPGGENGEKRRWEYPQCFFTEEYNEIFDAGKGLPIKETPVTLPIFNYDIIGNLTDAAVPERESISANTRIVKVILADGTEIGTNIGINLHTSSWMNGNIDTTVTNAAGDEIEVKDLISGSVDFITNTVTVSSASQQVKQVVFAGYLSNTLNERSVSIEYTRDERQWIIEDSHRVNIPFTIEELEEAKALLQMDLYTKTYNEIGKYLTDMEDNEVIKFLDDEWEKYSGVELDPLGFNSFIRTTDFNCDATIATTALPSDYIENMLKFTIDRFLIDLTDTAKMEDMTFVVYGNPKYISLLGDKVKWVVNKGGMTGGIKNNYSYGIFTSGDVKVQVVSALKFSSQGDKHAGLRIIPYPLNKEQMTFKHWKFTSHVLTNKDSAYKAADRPGGSYSNIVGLSRYTNGSVQGIQGYITFSNAQFINSNKVSTAVVTP